MNQPAEETETFRNPIDIGDIGPIDFTTSDGELFAEQLYSLVAGDGDCVEALNAAAQFGAIIVYEIGNQEQREAALEACAREANYTGGAEPALYAGYYRALARFWERDLKSDQPAEFDDIICAIDTAAEAAFSENCAQLLTGE